MSYYIHKLPSKNRDGVTLITSLMVIAIIALLSMAAAYSAVVEKRIANNMLKNTSVFYAAESGLVHAEAVLLQEFVATGSWVSTLDGSKFAAGAPATLFHCQGCEAALVTDVTGAWLAGGVEVLNITYPFDGLNYNYVVTAWNNNDGPQLSTPPPAGCTATTSATVDCDSRIVIRSVATAMKSGASIGESIQERVIFAAVAAGTLPKNSGKNTSTRRHRRRFGNY